VKRVAKGGVPCPFSVGTAEVGMLLTTSAGPISFVLSHSVHTRHLDSIEGRGGVIGMVLVLGCRDGM
jgi:hypothetical protein